MNLSNSTQVTAVYVALSTEEARKLQALAAAARVKDAGSFFDELADGLATQLQHDINYYEQDDEGEFFDTYGANNSSSGCGCGFTDEEDGSLEVEAIGFDGAEVETLTSSLEGLQGG